MTQHHNAQTAARLKSALTSSDSSTRLRVAMAAGTHPAPEYVDVLIAQCAVEPDFFVRDMLTWALTRHGGETTVDRLLAELESPIAQARSQSLHTLSKLGDRRAWPAITTALLTDRDDEVARAAWRAATGLVPEGSEAELAKTLATQLGRGDREMHLSLSRAFVALGPKASVAVERAQSDRDEGVRTHALATEHLMKNPDDGMDAAIAEAQRVVALLGAPAVEE